MSYISITSSAVPEVLIEFVLQRNCGPISTFKESCSCGSFEIEIYVDL